jgi:hypothetical protein
VARFNLQFDVREVPAYAARYAYEDDTVVLAIGGKARKRGHYTLEEFIAVESQEYDDLRQNSPFAGLLSEPERRRIVREVI